MPAPFTYFDGGSTANNLQASSGVTPLATNASTLALAAPNPANGRNFVTGIHAVNVSATVGTTFSILDGATPIWTSFLPATTAALVEVPITKVFNTPLRASPGNAINVQCGTTGATVYWNLQGFSGQY